MSAHHALDRLSPAEQRECLSQRPGGQEVRNHTHTTESPKRAAELTPTVDTNATGFGRAPMDPREESRQATDCAGHLVWVLQAGGRDRASARRG